MARKKPRKKPTRKARSGGRTVRCKYVGKRASKRVANRLAKDLRCDGFRAVVSSSPRGVAGGYDVFSCGKMSGRAAKTARRGCARRR
jgi:hypothetical protein